MSKEETRSEYISRRYSETRARVRELQDKAEKVSGFDPSVPYRKYLSFEEAREYDSYSRYELGQEYDRLAKQG